MIDHRLSRTNLVTLVIVLGLPAAAAEARKAWDFTAEKIDATPKGFTAAAGNWQVVNEGPNKVLAQRAKSEDDVFNVVLIDGTSFKDLDLSVRFKPVEGDLDRGGGLVWRAKDAKNYYVARFNPLENNFRVYKVVNGVRTMFRSADLTLPTGWHVLRVTMSGLLMRCIIDDETYLEVEDGTFADAGQVGLWTKADARTFFDDLTVQ